MQQKLRQTGEGAGESPAPQNWAHSAKGAHPYRKACRSTGMKVAAPPLDSPCDGPVTYPGDIKTLRIPSKGRSGPTLNTVVSLYEKGEAVGRSCCYWVYLISERCRRPCFATLALRRDGPLVGRQQCGSSR